VRAIARLIAGLLALPGLLALAHVAIPTLRRSTRNWLLAAAIAWPILATGEIAYRFVSASRIPYGGLFHNPDLLAGLSALSLISEVRGRFDFVRILIGVVIVLQLMALWLGEGLPFEVRATLGALEQAASIAMGITVAWYGSRLIDSK
jgi:hypothetical protein